MTEPTAEQQLLRYAFGLLGDGAGEEWDDNREYTRGIVQLVGDAIGLPGPYDERRAEILARIRASAPRFVYVVDEQGATWWFHEREKAEQHLVNEAWRGAVHLVIGKLEIPRDLDDRQITDYCIAHAPHPGCDN